ncbi:glutaredoxin domain-containing protein [Shigella flexneri]
MPSCGFSAQAVQALAACGERFADVEILQNPDFVRNCRDVQLADLPQLWVDGERSAVVIS